MSEPVKKNERLEEIGQFNFSQEKTEDEQEIYEAFGQLSEESLKSKRTNSSAFKKLHELEFEKERLIIKLEESNRSLNELMVEKDPRN